MSEHARHHGDQLETREDFQAAEARAEQSGAFAPRLSLTGREQLALAEIERVQKSILELSGPGKQLAVNHQELSQAIHVLQGFVKQHVLHRVDPAAWASWWS